MRHVDHADQPVGDRQSERSQQQNASETESRKQRPYHLDFPLFEGHCLQGIVGSRSYFFVGFGVGSIFLFFDQREQ